jgi:ketosteroid isomerase-like protein
MPEYYNADAEYHVAREDPDSAVHHGIDAITKQLESWIEAYPDLKLEPSDAKANGDHVFAWVRFVGHGAGSGLPVEMEVAHVITLRDGKIARQDEYYDRAEALKAAGLAG